MKTVYSVFSGLAGIFLLIFIAGWTVATSDEKIPDLQVAAAKVIIYKNDLENSKIYLKIFNRLDANVTIQYANIFFDCGQQIVWPVDMDMDIGARTSRSQKNFLDISFLTFGMDKEKVIECIRKHKKTVEIEVFGKHWVYFNGLISKDIQSNRQKLFVEIIPHK